MKEIRARLFAPVLRGLDACLPPEILYRLLWPMAASRAAFHRLIKGRPRLPPWPGCMAWEPPPAPRALQRLPDYLQRTLEYLPDRLDQPRWRGRCVIQGLAPVRAAIDRGQPVLIGVCHFGAVALLRNWLRAAGVPLVGFAGGQAAGRATLARRKDRWALFPEIPTVVYQDQLDQALRLLKGGTPLAIALDGANGHQMRVPMPGGWTFQMATGPLRMAAHHDASLFPCTVVDLGSWRYALHMGDPVPRDLLSPPAQVEAGAHLLRAMLPHFASYPHQWHRELFERFHPPDPTPAGALP